MILKEFLSKSYNFLTSVSVKITCPNSDSVWVLRPGLEWIDLYLFSHFHHTQWSELIMFLDIVLSKQVSWKKLKDTTRVSSNLEYVNKKGQFKFCQSSVSQCQVGGFQNCARKSTKIFRSRSDKTISLFFLLLWVTIWQIIFIHETIQHYKVGHFSSYFEKKILDIMCTKPWRIGPFFRKSISAHLW